jgi:hypothetical protein
MTSAGWIFVGIFGAGVGICGLWATLLAMEARDHVNKLRPPDKQFPILFGNFTEWQVRRDYRQRFPKDECYKKANRLTVLMFVCGFLMFAVPYLFFRKYSST